MAPSSKPQALGNRMERMDADVVARVDKFFDILGDMKDNTFRIYEEKIRDCKFVEDDKKARMLAADIEADLKATTQNIFAVQKYARELIAQAESLERAADSMYQRKNDISTRLYTVVQQRSGEKWD